ncbi:helix-turn-helix domain-containing protein [Paenibacillus sp. HJL G12]|uniref:Helix-turn-helix domain-containing protein n=1 Tax=Paenibacillus dendrobii TaxID=2691084 RepID=A0A7X3ILE4_9BACL|nr:helix-turn-helix domain-containing protein [Paenibacillus dendrobii]MWV46074.1 helix-turn-helix domain-containing protein [Paenibacillus dendrobii]
MYWKTIALAILLTCVPISIVSFISWHVGNQYLIRQHQQNNEELVKDTARQIDEQFSQLVQYAVHMISNPILKPSLADRNFVDQFEKTQELSDTLYFIENGDPLIDQAYLYVEKQNKIMQPMLGLRTLDNPADAVAWRNIMRSDKGIFWTNHLSKPFNQGNSSHAIVMKLPFNSQQSYGALVLYVNPAKVHLNANSEQVAFVLDGEDTLVGQSDASMQYPEVIPDIQEVMSTTKRSYDTQMHFQLPMKNDKLLVSALSFEKMGGIWTFVSGTPSSAITAPTGPYRHVVLTYWGVSLLLALALSWFASKRMYRPIRRMVDLFKEGKSETTTENNELKYIEEKWRQYRSVNETLQSNLNQSIPKVREALINQFVSGQAAHLTESEIAEKLQGLQLDITKQHFFIIVCQLHSLSEDRGQLTAKDHQLLAYAAINLLHEMSERLASYVHTIDFMDGSFAVIGFVPAASPVEELKSPLKELSADMIGTLRDVMNMPATIVVSGPAGVWTDVPYLLEQGRRALSYRSFTSESQLLEASVVLEQANLEVEFPFDLEQEFTHTLNLGLEKEAEEILIRFVEVLQNDGAPEWVVHQGLMRLKNSLYRSMLQSNRNPYALYDGVKLQEELEALRDSNACIGWFRTSIIKPYIEVLHKSYHQSMKHIVDQVILTIKENYMSDISLETLATEANVSVSQLSKAFRQMTGSNYIDYLTSIKMNHCKKLLVTTDMKISEIAKAVSYQPPYFNRMFKKLEGMTPGQYREQFNSVQADRKQA